MFAYMKQKPGFYRQVVTLAAPIVLQNMITSTLSMADTFMVGLLGEAPMAAVTLANIPLFVVQLFIFGVQSGASVLISQYWGKGDRASINRVMGVALWVALAFSTVVAVILLICPVEFLSLFGNQRDVVVMAAEYGRYAGWAYVFNAVTMVYAATYRSMERPKLGMYVLGVSMCTNLFLNWVLIFGNLGAPALGVAGAAIATMISRILEVVIVVCHMTWNRFFRVELKWLFLPGPEMFHRFLRYGGLVVCNETLWGLGTSLLPTIMGHMEGSTEILAAYTVASNVEKLCTVVAFGLAATASVIIGREIGAGRGDQVKSIGAALDTMAFACGIVFGGLLLCFVRFVAPVWVFPLFKLSPGAVSAATIMLTVIALVMPLRDFNGVNVVGVLRGGGDVKAATLIDTGPLWVFAIPYAALCGLVLRTPVFWVFLYYVVEQVTKSAIGLWRMRSGRWVRDLTKT